MVLQERRIEGDLLIIGGGSAGSMAAIRAKEITPSLRVIIFEKGDIKYSGSIARGMDALNVVAVPGVATPGLYLEATNIACEGVVDSKPSYVMADRSFDMLKRLEGWGVHFPRDPDGSYITLQVHPKGKFLVSMLEPELKVMLAERLLEMGCTVVNRTMAVQLLKEGNRAVGAVGLNTRTGELVICKAKAVILATGGQSRFGLPNSGYLFGTFDYPGNTGDGYYMGYQIGAHLTGFEYTATVPIVRDIGAPLLYITLTRGAQLLDAFGESIKGNLGTRELSAVYEAGRDPLSIKLSHLPEEKIKEIEDIIFTTERPAVQRFFKGRGIDFRKTNIEIAPTEYFLCSGHGMAGLVVNEKAETDVEGLYAVGDTASVPRQHLSGAFVFGQVAAESAAQYIENLPPVAIDERQVNGLRQDKIEALEKSKGTVTVREFEYKVRRTINDLVIPPKNEYKLMRAMEWMKQFRRELRELVRVRNSHELAKVFEIEHIIESAALSARASLERKESRWGLYHKRVDYPEVNDAEWLKHILLSRGETPEGIGVSFKSIDKTV